MIIVMIIVMIMLVFILFADIYCHMDVIITATQSQWWYFVSDPIHIQLNLVPSMRFFLSY